MFSPCVGDGSYEVELVEAEAEVQLPEAGGEQPGGDHREVGGALRLLWLLQHRLHADSLGEL